MTLFYHSLLSRHASARVIALAALLCIANQVYAFEILGVTGSGSFSATCGGGVNPSAGLNVGAQFHDNTQGFVAGSDCTSQTGAVSASLWTVSSFNDSGATASGTSSHQPSILNGYAKMDSVAQNSLTFPTSYAESGWIDTLTIEHPSYTGKVATVKMALNLNGSVSATGVNVFSRIQLLAETSLAGNLITSWQVQSFNNISEQQVITEPLLIDFKFVVGTPGEWIVRMLASAATSSQTSLGNNGAETSFQLNYGGIQQVTVDGQVISGYSLSSASGYDWAKPVPLPGTLVLFLSAGIGLTMTRLRLS